MVLYIGLTELSALFNHHGWTSSGLIDSNEGTTFYKNGHETEYFELRYSDIRGPNEPIYVSVPLRNSTFQYVLYFKDFEKATNYMAKMFGEYNNLDVSFSISLH
jgi:hypothetical protein